MKDKFGWVVLICILVFVLIWLVNPGIVGMFTEVISPTTTTSTTTTTITEQKIEFKCPKPYIQVGENCCLDKNENNICDNDEKCPPSCDDGDACTQDYCSYETNYECRHKALCSCGDGICNLEESFKTCKEDCLPTNQECASGYPDEYFNLSTEYTCQPLNYYTILYSENDFRNFYEFCSNKRAYIYSVNQIDWGKFKDRDIVVNSSDDEVDFSGGITLACGTPELSTCLNIPDYYCYLRWGWMNKRYYEYPQDANHVVEKECNGIKSGQIIQNGNVEFYNGLKIYKPSLCRIDIKES